MLPKVFSTILGQAPKQRKAMAIHICEPSGSSLTPTYKKNTVKNCMKIGFWRIFSKLKKFKTLILQPCSSFSTILYVGLPMLKFNIEIRKILSHGSTSFDWWNKISKYFDSWAIQSMSNWPFQKMKFFMSTEKIYNITEFDFRLKTITDSGSNNSNENINSVIIKVICWITSPQLWNMWWCDLQSKIN